MRKRFSYFINLLSLWNACLSNKNRIKNPNIQFLEQKIPEYAKYLTYKFFNNQTPKRNQKYTAKVQIKKCRNLHLQY